MGRKILFSVTAKDCRFDFYVGSGKGGQKRNKTSNCCRCTHIESGASGKSEEGRSQLKNKQKAFVRMATSDTFKKWHRIEVAKRTGVLRAVEVKVEEMMREKNLKIEKRINGKWVIDI